MAFNGDYNTLYAVTGHSHHGTVLNLAVANPPLSDTVHAGDTYNGIYRFDRLVVRGGAKALARDHVVSTNAAEVAAGSTWNEAYAPTLQITAPNAGATYTSGASIAISADAQDLLGVRDVEFRMNGQTSVDTAAPYAWSVLAPSVTQGTDYPITVIATDLSGNKLTATRTVHVDSIVDPNPPVVTLTGCVTDGEVVAAGIAVSIPFTATDDQQIQSYSLVVDGQTVQTTSVAQPSVTATLSWTPPANTAPGTAFVVRVEARDYGDGVGYQAMTLRTPPTTPRTGTQSLTAANSDGADVYLGSGTFTVTQAISPSSLILMSGAKVVGVAGQTAKIAVTGTARVQCGASIDLSNLGYAGTTAANSPGIAPAGVVAARVDAGGNHGGLGSVWVLGPAGDTFDSVYLPHQGGGSGSLVRSYSGNKSGAGGGVLDLTAGELVVSGSILAKGEVRPNRDSDTPGAGGTIAIHAGTVRGKGLIDASGGKYDVYYYGGGSAGGGRVALFADTLQGFDPATQVKAWGGAVYNSNGTVNRFAGPGTVFIKTAAQAWGQLVVDSGEENNADRVGPATPLPALGTGSLATFQVQGADALVAVTGGFKDPWLGAWMELLNAGGTSLGTFRVQSIDGSGQALLTDAGAAATAASFRGVYRFDRIDLRNGAGSRGDRRRPRHLGAERRQRAPAADHDGRQPDAQGGRHGDGGGGRRHQAEGHRHADRRDRRRARRHRARLRGHHRGERRRRRSGRGRSGGGRRRRQPRRPGLALGARPGGRHLRQRLPAAPGRRRRLAGQELQRQQVGGRRRRDRPDGGQPGAERRAAGQGRAASEPRLRHAGGRRLGGGARNDDERQRHDRRLGRQVRRLLLRRRQRRRRPGGAPGRRLPGLRPRGPDQGLGWHGLQLERHDQPLRRSGHGLRQDGGGELGPADRRQRRGDERHRPRRPGDAAARPRHRGGDGGPGAGGDALVSPVGNAWAILGRPPGWSC